MAGSGPLACTQAVGPAVHLVQAPWSASRGRQCPLLSPQKRLSSPLGTQYRCATPRGAADRARSEGVLLTEELTAMLSPMTCWACKGRSVKGGALPYLVPENQPSTTVILRAGHSNLQPGADGIAPTETAAGLISCNMPAWAAWASATS